MDYEKQLEIVKKSRGKIIREMKKVHGSIILKKMTRLKQGSSGQVVISDYIKMCQWLNEK